MVLEPLRLCHLRKRQDFDGYGFSLNAERGVDGQFIGSIDRGSPAEAAGLKVGDRLIEVNGMNVLQDSHAQVVTRIKSIEFETKFLVISENGYLNCVKQNIPIKKESYSIIKLYSEPGGFADLIFFNFLMLIVIFNFFQKIRWFYTHIKFIVLFTYKNFVNLFNTNIT